MVTTPPLSHRPKQPSFGTSVVGSSLIWVHVLPCWAEVPLTGVAAEFLLAYSQPKDTVVMELSIACHYISMLASTFFPDLNFIVFCEAPMDVS